MVDLQFSPVLWELLDGFYEEEWEGYLRPNPGDSFEWQYAVFYEDKCVNCPLVWMANMVICVTGFELKMETGHIFIANIDTPVNMIVGDTLSLDQFVIPRTNNKYGD